jgi:hypothetical protein
MPKFMHSSVTKIGRVDFRNDDRVFGIKHEDRFSHVYVIGKTGTGKSTLIESMALQDLQRGNGFALIDPHGDLVARVAAQIPASQRNRAPAWRMGLLTGSGRGHSRWSA